MESDLRLRFSSNQSLRVGANATSDTLVVLPFPAGLTDRILFAMSNGMVEPINLETSYANAFWSKDISGENSLIVFAGEYTRYDGTRNKNQLAMDFGTAQSQRRALGLDPGIIWGATCAKGCFEVFSSEWVNNVRFSLLSTHHVAPCFLSLSLMHLITSGICSTPSIS
jgi:hypothetical protein